MAFQAAVLKDRLDVFREGNGFLRTRQRAGRAHDPASHRQTTNYRGYNRSVGQASSLFGRRNSRVILVGGIILRSKVFCRCCAVGPSGRFETQGSERVNELFQCGHIPLLGKGGEAAALIKRREASEAPQN